MTDTRTRSGLAGLLARGILIASVVSGAAVAANAPRDPFNGRQTYSGSNMGCLVTNDFYAVHFSALQEGRNPNERTEFVKYCQEIPSVGKTYLSIDLLDRDVRKTPVALKVVEESYSSDGQAPREVRTLVEVPARVYKNGTADTQVAITEPGHYALIATIGEEAVSEDDQLRVPFSVGIAPAPQIHQYFGKITGALVALFFAVMGVIGFRAFRSYRPTAETPAPVVENSSWTGQVKEKRT